MLANRNASVRLADAERHLTRTGTGFGRSEKRRHFLQVYLFEHDIIQGFSRVQFAVGPALHQTLQLSPFTLVLGTVRKRGEQADGEQCLALGISEGRWFKGCGHK